VVTSHDVARLAGVSQATVSRTLNGVNTVSEAARERVLSAAAELGYLPNASARAMRTATASAIGIVTAELTNPFIPELVNALSRCIQQSGSNAVLWNDVGSDATAAIEGAARGTVDAVMFVAARASDTGFNTLARRGIPVVMVSRADPSLPIDQVTSDHQVSGYSSAQYLLRNGRRRFAGVFGPSDTFASPERSKGFLARLDEEGVARPDQWMFGETSYRHGYEAGRRLLESGTLPEAVFCSADIIAFGVLGALREAGVSIPDDVWVMGCDGLPMSEWEAFDLTTQAQNVDSIATHALELLHARQEDPTASPRRVRVRTELIARGSTAHAN
jgi:LacI family transcriptional regulator